MDIEEDSYFEVAEPVGIIAGVTPVTNPTSTVMFKCLIAVKTRNPIIFSFHPKAQKCSTRAAEILRDAAVKSGAPDYCIQWIDSPSVMPYVIRYNASSPTKFIAYPKYEYPHANERYAEIAKALGLNASTTEEGINSLIDALRKLMVEIDIPLTLKDAGIKKEDLDRTIDYMANNAFADQCTGTNPRMPLVDELKEIYMQAYEGSM